MSARAHTLHSTRVKLSWAGRAGAIGDFARKGNIARRAHAGGHKASSALGGRSSRAGASRVEPAGAESLCARGAAELIPVSFWLSRARPLAHY